MDLSDFDPYHPSNSSEKPPDRLFPTPSATSSSTTGFNSLLTSNRFNSNTPPPPPPLPSKLVSKDPLDSFDLFSFESDCQKNGPASIVQPSILAQNARQESTFKDLNRDPWGSFSESLPSTSTIPISQSFLLPPPGSILPPVVEFPKRNLVTTATPSTFSPLPARPVSNSRENLFNTVFLPSTSDSAFSSLSSSANNAFDDFDDFESGVSVEGQGSAPNQAVVEEDWWSGFQSGTATPQETTFENASNDNFNREGRDWEESISYKVGKERGRRRSHALKGKDKALPAREKERENTFGERREDWNYDVGGVDAIQPIQLLGVAADEHRALDEDIAEGIRPNLPPRLRLSRKWNLIYSLDQHGISITTMYERMQEDPHIADGGVVLVVKDGNGSVFGAYVNQGLINQSRYYGDGSCFLWKSTPFEPSDFRVGSSIKTFKWTGKNDYLILSDSNFLSVGGGNGKFGLWIDSVFEKGFSARCPCFDNEPLTDKYEKGVLDGEEAKFDVVMFEIWSVDS